MPRMLLRAPWRMAALNDELDTMCPYLPAEIRKHHAHEREGRIIHNVPVKYVELVVRHGILGNSRQSRLRPLRATVTRQLSNGSPGEVSRSSKALFPDGTCKRL